MHILSILRIKEACSPKISDPKLYRKFSKIIENKGEEGQKPIGEYPSESVIDSISVSVFNSIFIELDKYRIRYKSK